MEFPAQPTIAVQLRAINEKRWITL